MRVRGPAAGLSAAWAFLACGSPTEPGLDERFPPAPDDTLPYVYVVPEDVGDGWTPASLSEVGLSESRLTQLIDLIREGIYGGVHGIVLVKDGRLVLEEYFSGIDFEAAVGDTIVGEWTHFDRERVHGLASVTKSITAMLLGAAMHRGAITRTDTALYDFFPDYAELRDVRKDSIHLHHVLTMSSGLEWDEWSYSYGDRRNDINALFSQSDPLRYILAKPTAAPPGDVWLYNGGGTILVGEAVARAVGESLVAFADAHLFGPLAIRDRQWIHLAGGVTYASGDLRLRPRDMAKLGLLLLRDGVWDGDRLLPEGWVATATTRHAETLNPGWGYGYQFWLFDFEVDGGVYPSFGARGWGGQMITLFPEQDLVVVLTGGNYLSSDPADAIVRRFVLEALR